MRTLLKLLAFGIAGTSTALVLLAAGVLPNKTLYNAKINLPTSVNHSRPAETAAKTHSFDQGEVLGIATAQTTKAPVANAPAITPDYINNLVIKQLDNYTAFLAAFGLGHANVNNNNPSTGSATGIVQNGNGGSTAVIGGQPIVSYYPAVPASGFTGGSLAGFTDLSAANLTTQTANIQGTLTVSGSASIAGSESVAGNFNAATSTLSALTVNGPATFSGSTTIVGLSVTGLNPGLTPGSVAFQGTTALAQDNANLFYDSINHRLGIGTTTPGQLLSVGGNMRLTGALFDSNNASGTLGMLLQSTGTGQQWVATSTLGISSGGAPAVNPSGGAGNYAPITSTYSPPATGLLARYSADSVSGADGTLISSVPNSTGGAAATAAGAFRPTLKTLQQGIHNTMRFFAGGTNGLTVPASVAVNSQAYSVFFVSRQNESGSSVNNGAMWFALGASTDGLYQVQVGAQNGQMDIFNNGGNGPSGLTMPQGVVLHGIGVGTAKTNFYMNENRVSVTLATPSAAVTGGTIGYWPSAGYFIDADVFEALIYDHQLSDAEYRSLLDWAKTVYGVAAPYGQRIITQGNSLTAGFGTNGRSYPQQVSERMTRSQVVNIGLGSQTTPLLTTQAPTALYPLVNPNMPTVCLLWEGRNDIVSNSASAATAYANIVTWAAGVHGTGCYTAVLTVLPSSGLNETTRTTLNTSLKTSLVNAGAADLVIDVAGDTRLQNNNDTTVYQVGGVHLTELGNQYVAEDVVAKIGNTHQGSITGTFASVSIQGTGSITPFVVASSTGSSLFQVSVSGNVGIGTTTPTLGPLVMASGAFVTAGGTWTNASDRNLKENFATLSPASILEKIDQLSVTQWDYKSEGPTVNHIGPVAQDFWDAFHLGNSQTSISTIDPAGVALLGIQALDQKIQALQGSVAGNATTSNLSVYNPTNFSGDSVGEAEIVGGGTSVRISFSQPYSYQPVVTFSPEGGFIPAYIAEKDAAGFTIQTLAPVTQNTTFDWHSFASPAEQLSVSGITQPIPLIWPAAPQASAQTTRPTDPTASTTPDSTASSTPPAILGDATTTPGQ